MVVEGTGMIAAAFRATGEPTVPGIIFACGVANSQTLDENHYDRERALLREKLADASRIGEPLVYFSGSPIYGDFSEPLRETSVCKPVTRYGRHQAECEDLIRNSRIPFLIARLPNVVGESKNLSQLIPSLVSQVLRGHVNVQRMASRDLLDVDDLVRIVQRLIRMGIVNETFNIASGHSTSVRTIVTCIGRALGATPTIQEKDGGDAQRFYIDQLASTIGALPFNGNYPTSTLNRYVSRIAAGLTDRVT